MAGKLLAVATVISLAVLLPPQRGHAAPNPVDAVPSAAGELAALADLSAALAHELRAEERRLPAACDVADVRDRLRDVRDTALAALSRLGTMWRTGRLRTGALAASEVLTNDLVALIYRADRAAGLAHALTTQRERGSCSPAAASASERSDWDLPNPLGAIDP